MDCFNLRSYPILGQSLENHFVADCSLVSGAKRESRQKGKGQARLLVACVAGVKRGRANLSARGRKERNLLSRAWPRVLISFPFLFERLPRRATQARLLVAVWGMS